MKPLGSPIVKDPFRAFQEELAKLDREIAQREAEKPAEVKFAEAKDEFNKLRARYDLSVADVIAFFPEEEGVAYLQQLIAGPEPEKPARRRKRDAI